MRRSILLLIPLLASCGGGDGAGSGGPRAAAVQTAELTGLYEGAGYEGAGQGEQRSRMCMVSEAPRTAAFGLVVETANGSCSGAGEAVRTDGLVRLAMAGDEDCSIEARIEGTQVAFPSAVPEGCAYYCAPGATLAGESFEKTGGSSGDALRATDLAGDPLCE